MPIQQVRFDLQTSIPAAGSMNGNLNPTSNKFMLGLFGEPGPKTRDCSSVTNKTLKKLMVTRNVGPFRVTGLKPAVESLATIFAAVKKADPRLFNEVQTYGVLCNRLVRGSETYWSNHSWGTAIDLGFGDNGPVPLGTPRTHIGVLKLYPYFHNAGWYWGAEFSRGDAMHFEVARETLTKWKKAGLLS